MAHPDWCGNPCSECKKPCDLDKSIPCSPDCSGLDRVTGKPTGADCKDCDAIRKE